MELSIAAEHRDALETWVDDQGQLCGEHSVGWLSRRPSKDVALFEAPGRVSFVRTRHFGEPGRSLAHVESRLLEDLRTRKLGVPEVAAVGVEPRGTSILWTSKVHGMRLDRWLDQPTAPVRQIVSRLGEELRRWHEAGVVHGQLFAWHVYLNADGSKVTFTDVEAATTAGRIAPWRRRSLDLAALFATLPFRKFGMLLRARLLQSYGIRSRELRRARGRLIRAHRHWRQRRRYPVTHRHAREVSGKEAVPWMLPTAATVIRERDGRRNLTLRRDSESNSEVWYGKLYPQPKMAADEAFHHEDLEWLNLPVSEVVIVARSHKQSVLWTRGIEPGTTLRDWFHRRSGDWRERRHVILKVARLVQRLHRAGFHHRDLYLDHFLIDDSRPEGLSLIDLARLREFPMLPTRCRVKDLAALEYSARTAQVSLIERQRFFREYRKGLPMNAGALWSAVQRKADRIQRHETRGGRFPVPCPSESGGAPCDSG